MKLTSKIYLLFIGCFVPVINYGQQLYKPAHFESPVQCRYNLFRLVKQSM